MTIDVSDKLVPIGTAAGVGGVLMFLYANRDKIKAIVSAVWSLASLWKMSPSKSAPPATQSSESLEPAVASLNSLNRLELKLVAEGKQDLLPMLRQARKATLGDVSDLDFCDDVAVCNLHNLLLYFEFRKNSAGIDAIVAAFNQIPQVEQL